MSKPFITTYTGRRFYPFNPRAEDVCLEDIAHALSMQCRFSGHVRAFYSVAEHSVFVSKYSPLEDRLIGLLHDASEAYLQDMASPIKHSGRITGYLEAEERISKAIAAAFGLPTIRKTAAVQAAEELVYSAEVWAFMNKPKSLTELSRKMVCGVHLQGWSPKLAEEAFLSNYHRIRKFERLYE